VQLVEHLLFRMSYSLTGFQIIAAFSYLTYTSYQRWTLGCLVIEIWSGQWKWSENEGV